MRRRQFSMGLAATGAALVSWPVAGRLLDAWTVSPAERLIAALGRPDSAAVVGRAYLAGHPRHAETARLVESVTARLRCRGCDPARSSRTHLRAAITRQVRDDFAQSRVVNVDGWVLSATEAELCGLAALARA